MRPFDWRVFDRRVFDCERPARIRRTPGGWVARAITQSNWAPYLSAGLTQGRAGPSVGELVFDGRIFDTGTFDCPTATASTPNPTMGGWNTKAKGTATW